MARKLELLRAGDSEAVDRTHKADRRVERSRNAERRARPRRCALDQRINTVYIFSIQVNEEVRMAAVASISELAHCVVVSLDQQLTAADAIKAVQDLAVVGPAEDRWPPLTARLASFPNYWMAVANALVSIDERTRSDLAAAGVKFGDMLISMRSAWSPTSGCYMYAVVAGVADRFGHCTVTQGDAKARYHQSEMELWGGPLF